MKIPMLVERLDERYNGEKTGRTVYHCSTKGCSLWSAVLGRGYSLKESLNDWVRRAQADGHNVNAVVPDVELVDRTEPGTMGVAPGICPPGSIVS